MYIYTNSFISQIQSLSLPNKYTDWYCQIVNRAQERASNREEAKLLLGYVEKHHILPQSFKLGGIKHTNNYAYLTAKEHFICHRLLVKMATGEYLLKMVRAMNAFRMAGSKNPRKLTSRQYEIIKTILAANPGWSKGRPSPMKGKPSPLKGTKFSEEAKLIHAAGMAKRKGIKQSTETCLKKSLAKKGKPGKPQSEESKAKRAATMKGRSYGPKSAEHKEKLSAALTGKTRAPEVGIKIAAALLGKKHSAERIAKRVSSTKATRERKKA